MISVGLGYDTYDYLPDERTNYPFVFIGEQFKQDDRIHKDSLNGRTQITVHVWHNDYKKRGDLSNMMNQIEQKVRKKYEMRLLQANMQIIVDRSTGTDLLHGMIDLDIKY